VDRLLGLGYLHQLAIMAGIRGYREEVTVKRLTNRDKHRALVDIPKVPATGAKNTLAASPENAVHDSADLLARNADAASEARYVCRVSRHAA
jgi:hypothetical protein